MPIWLTTIVVLGISAGDRARSQRRRPETVPDPLDQGRKGGRDQPDAGGRGLCRNHDRASPACKVWQEFSDAKAAVAHEAATASQLYQDLTIFGRKQHRRAAPCAPMSSASPGDEWPQLGKGEGRQVTEAALQRVFAEVGARSPGRPVPARYEEMLGNRPGRLHATEPKRAGRPTGMPLLLRPSQRRQGQPNDRVVRFDVSPQRLQSGVRRTPARRRSRSGSSSTGWNRSTPTVCWAEGFQAGPS